MSKSFEIFKCRDTFRVLTKETLRWFPGHMDKGMKQMQQKLKLVDLVVEVHDARIPLSGRNNVFKTTITPIKPHILVLNKKDLTVPYLNGKVKAILNAEGIENVIYTNCRDDTDKGVKTLFPMMQDLIKNSERYNRSDTKDFNIMVIGVPNVGKSSLINRLRNKFLKRGNASAVGGTPGITKSVLNKIKISEDPLIYLFDTPGILTPNVETIEMGLKLALCHCLQDHLVGENIIADYLLFWLNQKQNYKYVEYMGLKEPNDNIMEVLVAGAVKNNWFITNRTFDNTLKKVPNITESAKYMMKGFRSGVLGNLLLDDEAVIEKFEKLKNDERVEDPDVLLEKDKVI